MKFLRSGLITFLLIITQYPTILAQIYFPFGSGFHYLKGLDTISSSWNTGSFDISSWDTGACPFWYGDGSGGTNLTDMQGAYSTVYLRSSFIAANIDKLETVSFSVNYDDGFVLWINGSEALRKNVPDTVKYNSIALANHESGVNEYYSIPVNDINLDEGENVLAVQLVNLTLGSSDIYFNLKIEASVPPDVLPELIDSTGVLLDHEAGFYDSSFELTLRSPDSSLNIIYTLDGSNPQTSPSAFKAGLDTTIMVDPASTFYRGKTPAFVVRASLHREGYLPSRPVTKTFIFTDQVKAQTYPGGTWPGTNVNDQVIDYDMDPEVVNDSRYKTQVVDALKSIPSISIVTDNANLFDPDEGIYVNARLHGEDWERECSMELINPDGSKGFQINAGLRIRGGNSRGEWNPKHAFRIFFRSKYGASKLNYPLFGETGAASFDKIDIRTEQNYSWSMDGDSHNTFVRDIFSHDTHGAMGQPYSRENYYHLYLNGMYWGLFETEERPEADFAASYLGDKDDDYDVVKVTVTQWPYYNIATDGNMDAWTYLWNKCKTGFTAESYFALEGKDINGRPVKNTRVWVDIDNLIDFMMVIFYTGNVDNPVSAWYSNAMPNNYFAIFNNKNKGQGFVFINHDAEHAMFIDPIYVSSGISENRVTINDPAMYANSVDNFQPQWLHSKLMSVPEYRQRFADRAFIQFGKSGVFEQSRASSRFMQRANEINIAIIAESARWGDSKATVPRTKDDDWLPEINSILTDYFSQRGAIVIQQMKDAHIYSLVNAPVIKESNIPFEETIRNFSSPVSISLENPNPSYDLFYTLDGTDPRNIGGAVSGTAIHGSLIQGLTIGNSTILKARTKNGADWSALRLVNFLKTDEDFSNLKLTEIFYHPRDIISGSDTIPGTDYEFIELKNTGTNSINLSGIQLKYAVDYTVPANTILPPGRFYVIASKPEVFYDRYGINPSGNYSGHLSNSGEYIQLVDKTGSEIFALTYLDNSPWPEEADGDGYSLASKDFNPSGDPGQPGYWVKSYQVNGNPFADNMAIVSVPENEAGSQAFCLYPNPTNGILNIKKQIGTGAIIGRIQIFNQVGLMVYDKLYNSDHASIDMNGLNISYGIYLVKISTGTDITVERINYLPL